MPTIKVPGRYLATVLDAQFGESEKGTPFLQLSFETDDNCHISSWHYLSEAAFPYTLKTLQDAFEFDGDFHHVVAQVKGKECSIVCEYETDDEGKERMKVKWVNAPRSAPKAIENQQSFLAALTAKAKGKAVPTQAKAPAPAKAPAAADDHDTPF